MPGKRRWGKGDGEREGRRPRAGMEGRKGKSSITWTKATRILCRRIALSSLGLSRIRTLRARIRTLETLEPEPSTNRVRNRTIGNSIFPTWLFGVPEKRKTIKIGDGRSDDSGGKFTQKMKNRDFHSIEFQ